MALTTEQRAKIIKTLALRRTDTITFYTSHLNGTNSVDIHYDTSSFEKLLEQYILLSDADLMALVLGAKDE